MNESAPWNTPPRRGVSDIWNSELYIGSEWSALDNPIVYCTAREAPLNIISWREAKRQHQKMLEMDDEYHVNGFIHCYIDDGKFDGDREGIWKRWKYFYEVSAHYVGIMGIDFSTNADFPEPVKRMQFHKMRAIEHDAIHRGISVIPNVRWGTRETWDYCFDALPSNSMLSIGVVGSGLKNIENRSMFDAGFRELVKRKRPSTLVVVGSAEYPVFDEAKSAGIAVVQFDGPTCSYFKARGRADV